jgi:hypothetical protein
MELTFECPQCGASGGVAEVERAESATCACGWSRPLRGTISGEGGLGACPFCATDELYVQKDFPHGLGLLIVIVGFAVSTIFWYYYLPALALAALLATAALDVVLYYLVPDVTICYRCLSQYRGAGSNPAGRFAPFDLAIGERYRQERLRIEELRARAGPDARP